MSTSQNDIEGFALPIRPARHNRKANFIDRHIGVAIRTLRREKSITQATLADTVGISFPQVQKYETGTNRLSVQMLIQIADALDLRPSDIIAEACRTIAEESRASQPPA